MSDSAAARIFIPSSAPLTVLDRPRMSGLSSAASGIAVSRRRWYDQHGTGRLAQDGLGGTAEQCLLEPGPPVQSEHDELGLLRRGHRQQHLGRRIGRVHLTNLVRHALGLQVGNHGIEGSFVRRGRLHIALGTDDVDEHDGNFERCGFPLGLGNRQKPVSVGT